MTSTPRVAYLVNLYPGISHTFIRREIRALEAAGMPIARYGLRGWSERVTDPADLEERQQTRYLLQGGAAPLVAAVLGWLVRHPGRLFSAIADAARLSRGHDRSWPYYVVYLAEAALLARWLRDDGIRHLHAHFGTNSAAVAMLAARLAGIGYSFTVHGPEEFDRPAAIQLARKIDAARFVVAISSFGRSQMYRWIPLAQWSRVQVVHCGLDRGFVDGPAASSTEAPSVDFVCVGRICEQKGQLLLVEALARLKQAGHRASLVLAGDGPMRGIVEDRARELGVFDQLRITGWIGGAQVQQELLQARAMVLPSFAEGLPVVIMEAMALRRPVISTYVAGIPELVQPGRTGWLVPAGDVERLAQALVRSLQIGQDEWTAMGRAARERVLERHAIDTEAGKLRRLFAQAIGDGGDRAAA